MTVETWRSMLRSWDELVDFAREPPTDEQCAFVREMAYVIWNTVREGRDNFPWVRVREAGDYGIVDIVHMRRVVRQCNEWDMEIKVKELTEMSGKRVYQFFWDNPQLE